MGKTESGGGTHTTTLLALRLDARGDSNLQDFFLWLSNHFVIKGSSNNNRNSALFGMVGSSR